MPFKLALRHSSYFFFINPFFLSILSHQYHNGNTIAEKYHQPLSTICQLNCRSIIFIPLLRCMSQMFKCHFKRQCIMKDTEIEQIFMIL